VADFNAIVRWREPDNPVKDGALSRPFFSLPCRSLEKAPAENGKVKNGCRQALTRVQIPMGAFFFFTSEAHSQSRAARLGWGCFYFNAEKWKLVVRQHNCVFLFFKT